MAPRDYKRVFRSLGQIAPVILVNGQIAGTWTQEMGKGQRTVSIRAFDVVSRAVRQGIEEEAARLGRFLGSRCSVKYSGRFEKH